MSQNRAFGKQQTPKASFQTMGKAVNSCITVVRLNACTERRSRVVMTELFTALHTKFGVASHCCCCLDTEETSAVVCDRGVLGKHSQDQKEPKRMKTSYNMTQKKQFLPKSIHCNSVQASEEGEEAEEVKRQSSAARLPDVWRALKARRRTRCLKTLFVYMRASFEGTSFVGTSGFRQALAGFSIWGQSTPPL